MKMQIGICGGEYEMKIYDISQEVFGCQVYPGDPTPKKRVISSMEKGDLYNLTAFSMCAHNGTHIDAPFHFIKDGKTVDSVSLNTFIGMAYVAEYNGIVSADDATEILEKAKKQNSEAAKRILIKGDAEVSAEAAKVFAESNILLLGNESQTALNSNYEPGDNVTYVINIVNSGTAALTGLTLKDDLGAYTLDANTHVPLTYVEDTIQYFINGVSQASPVVTIAGGLSVTGLSVPAGGNTTLLYETKVNDYANPTALSTITNTANLSGDSLYNDLSASATITAAATTNLSISKSVCPDSVVENGQLTYTFVIQNTGSLAAQASDNVVISDTFDPILNPITVTFDNVTWTVGTNYSYDTTTGVFNTIAGQITVPAATYTQNPATGIWTLTPGVSVLKVTGTV